jgi:hypothetical protein
MWRGSWWSVGSARVARAFCSAWIAGCLLGVPAEFARAQALELAVLGLTSDEGDDAFAGSLTAALRAEAGAESQVRLSSTRASLSQMIMVHDCEMDDAECRARIGRALAVDQVIYGRIHRAGARGHRVELHRFDTRDGSQVSARRVIPSADSTDSALSTHARALLAVLRGDAEPVRPTEERAPAVLTVTPDVEPLEGGDETAIDMNEPAFDDGSGVSSNAWAGYTLLGLAAVSAGLTVYSWTQIKAAQDDVAPYRTAVFNANRRDADVCPLAEDDMRFGLSERQLAATRSACGRGQTFEVLQYVFIGAAVVSAGLGAYFLIDDDGGDRAAKGNRLALRAQAGPGRGLVSLRLAY